MTAPEPPLAGLGSPAFFARPDVVLRRLLREAPVHYDPRLDAWFISRHADIVSVLRDPGFSVARAGAITGLDADSDRARWCECQAFLSGLMVVLDPPMHTRRRGLVARAFTRARLEAYREPVRELADRMVEKSGRFECRRQRQLALFERLWIAVREEEMDHLVRNVFRLKVARSASRANKPKVAGAFRAIGGRKWSPIFGVGRRALGWPKGA